MHLAALRAPAPAVLAPRALPRTHRTPALTPHAHACKACTWLRGAGDQEPAGERRLHERQGAEPNARGARPPAAPGQGGEGPSGE